MAAGRDTFVYARAVAEQPGRGRQTCRRHTRMSGMTHPFLRPLPAGLEALAELTLDLRWAWSHAADR